MDALKLGVQPHIGVHIHCPPGTCPIPTRQKVGKMQLCGLGRQTFLHTSPIATKLIVQIQASQDSWAKELWNEKSIESWIHLGNDDVLASLLKRFMVLFRYPTVDRKKGELLKK